MKTHDRSLTAVELTGHPDTVTDEMPVCTHLLSITAIHDAPPAVPAESWALGWKWAGTLAFGQSLLFLALWLWLCAHAGAATGASPELEYQIIQSSYTPDKGRDPFARPGAVTQQRKPMPGTTLVFQLQGILYEGAASSAIINDKLVTLNKTVTLTTGNAEVPVRAIEITRDRVTLEAAGQRIELRLNPQESAATDQPR